MTTGDVKRPALIRIATEQDAAEMVQIYAPAVTDSVASFETELPTPEEMAGRLRATLPRLPWLVCEDGRRIAGYAYAGITLPNPASIGLHEAVGFHPVGIYNGVGYKLGAWHDVGWWQKELGTHPAEPSTPVTFDDLCGSPACAAALAAGSNCLCPHAD